MAYDTLIMVRISAAACLKMGLAIPPVLRRPGGNVLAPIDRELLALIKSRGFPEESISDTIERLVFTEGGLQS